MPARPRFRETGSSSSDNTRWRIQYGNRVYTGAVAHRYPGSEIGHRHINLSGADRV